MRNRSVAGLLVLTIVTLGIYGLYWMVSTKREMNNLGAQIPTSWLIIIPIANIWWVWKYSEGVEHVTGGKMTAVLAFILQYLLGVIGMMIIQNEFNKVGAAPVPVSAEPVVSPAVTN